MTTTDTQLGVVAIRPGINKNTTEYDAEGEYINCDKIRFHKGKPEKMGGWQREAVSTTITGVARAIKTWRDLENQRHTIIGTHNKLMLRDGGTYSDITPITRTATSITITTTSGDSIVYLNDASHNRNAGDYVIFSNGSAYNGVTLDGEYLVTDSDASGFYVDSGTNATGSGTGSSVDIDYLLFSGLESNDLGFGWGAGTWGTAGASSGGWSDPRIGSGLSLKLRQWSLSNWGEDIIANPRKASLYLYDTSAGGRATEITQAPDQINYSLVGPARHVIAFGCTNSSGDFDPLLVRWCDSEDYTDWTATSTNSAGSFRLEYGNEIIGAVQSRREIVIFTDTSVYTMTRIGGAAVFSFDPISKGGTGLISQEAAIDTGEGVVYWMAPNGFYYYDGSVRTLPCSVFKFIFEPDSDGYINYQQKEKIHAAINKEFSEIIWFWPDKNNNEINRYVIYNYSEGTWYDGTMNRTCWTDAEVYDRPYAFDENGVLYIHEQGKDADGAALEAFLETSYFDLGDGDNLLFCDRVVPDWTISKTVTLDLYGKKYPNSQTETTKTYTLKETTPKKSVRLRARQMKYKLTTNETKGDFRLGKFRFSLKLDGGR